MHVAIDVPPLLTVFKCHFTHERSLATTFLAKDHKELIWIAILKEMISKKRQSKTGQSQRVEQKAHTLKHPLNKLFRDTDKANG